MKKNIFCILGVLFVTLTSSYKIHAAYGLDDKTYYFKVPIKESWCSGSSDCILTFDSVEDLSDGYFTLNSVNLYRNGVFLGHENKTSYNNDYLYTSISSSKLGELETNSTVLYKILSERFELNEPTNPPLVEVMKGVEMSEVMTILLSLVGLVVSSLVSWMALRKSWNWLLVQLQQS